MSTLKERLDDLPIGGHEIISAEIKPGEDIATAKKQLRNNHYYHIPRFIDKKFTVNTGTCEIGGTFHVVMMFKRTE